jgi:hypothetical protein
MASKTNTSTPFPPLEEAGIWTLRCSRSLPASKSGIHWHPGAGLESTATSNVIPTSVVTLCVETVPDVVWCLITRRDFHFH